MNGDTFQNVWEIYCGERDLPTRDETSLLAHGAPCWEQYVRYTFTWILDRPRTLLKLVTKWHSRLNDPGNTVLMWATVRDSARVWMSLMEKMVPLSIDDSKILWAKLNLSLEKCMHFTSLREISTLTSRVTVLSAHGEEMQFHPNETPSYHIPEALVIISCFLREIRTAETVTHVLMEWDIIIAMLIIILTGCKLSAMTSTLGSPSVSQ
jgi:hypothetical protein